MCENLSNIYSTRKAFSSTWFIDFIAADCSLVIFEAVAVAVVVGVAVVAVTAVVAAVCRQFAFFHLRYSVGLLAVCSLFGIPSLNGRVQ